MKRYSVILVLLFLLFCSFSYAQDQPIALNPNMLVHSQGLPNADGVQ